MRAVRHCSVVLGTAVLLATCDVASPDPAVDATGTADEVLAVFADHEVRPCSEVDTELGHPIFVIEVDGELSDDPEVASAQRGRAAYGFASDLDTVLTVMADPANADNIHGIPMTSEELTDLEGRNYHEQRAEIRRYLLDHTDTFGFLYVDQQAGGVFTLGFTRDLEARRTDLEQHFPDLPIEVVEAEFTNAELEAAGEPLMPAMQERRLSLGSIGLGLFRMEVGLAEPSRDDLDTIAEVTDPDKVCVRIQPPAGGLPDLSPSR